MIRTARLLSVSCLLCGLVPAVVHAQAPTAVTGTTAQSAPAASPGAPAAKAEPPATAQTRQVSVQAGTGVLLRLPQPAATVMSAEPAIARVQPASPTSLFLMGVSAGRTTVIATNDTGAAIVQYDVTVTPGTASQPAIARAWWRPSPDDGDQFGDSASDPGNDRADGAGRIERAGAWRGNGSYPQRHSAERRLQPSRRRPSRGVTWRKKAR